MSVNLDSGFPIEEPAATVRWGCSQEELKECLGDALSEVTTGYYTLSCASLGGMRHELGFHFSPRTNGKLVELEFFRRSYPDQAASYNEFQQHFEAAFGRPDTSEPGGEGFPSHRWEVGKCTIVHFVHDRFGPEEHMRIRYVGRV